MRPRTSKAVPLVTIIAMLALAVSLIAEAGGSSAPKQQSGTAATGTGTVDVDALELNPE